MPKKITTLQQRQIIENSLKKGFGYEEISEIISIKPIEIEKEVKGKRKGEYYCAKNAHKGYLERQKIYGSLSHAKRRERISKKMLLNEEKATPIESSTSIFENNYEQRIVSLEMQIQILSETMNRLLNDRNK